MPRRAQTIAVLFVGIGIKLALYDPTAPTDAHFSDMQRLQLGLSLAFCFALELLSTPPPPRFEPRLPPADLAAG